MHGATIDLPAARQNHIPTEVIGNGRNVTEIDVATPERTEKVAAIVLLPRIEARRDVVALLEVALDRADFLLHAEVSGHRPAEVVFEDDRVLLVPDRLSSGDADRAEITGVRAGVDSAGGVLAEKPGSTRKAVTGHAKAAKRKTGGHDADVDTNVSRQ